MGVFVVGSPSKSRTLFHRKFPFKAGIASSLKLLLFWARLKCAILLESTCSKNQIQMNGYPRVPLVLSKSNIRNMIHCSKLLSRGNLVSSTRDNTLRLAKSPADAKKLHKTHRRDAMTHANIQVIWCCLLQVTLSIYPCWTCISAAKKVFHWIRATRSPFKRVTVWKWKVNWKSSEKTVMQARATLQFELF